MLSLRLLEADSGCLSEGTPCGTVFSVPSRVFGMLRDGCIQAVLEGWTHTALLSNCMQLVG